jgi:hypothetical protein
MNSLKYASMDIEMGIAKLDSINNYIDALNDKGSISKELIQALNSKISNLIETQENLCKEITDLIHEELIKD